MFRRFQLAVAIAALACCVTGCSQPTSESRPSAPPGGTAPAAESPSGTQAANSDPRLGFVRPPLVMQTGQYFRWVMPAGWTHNETASGVDMTSPNGKTSASATVLVGSRGQTDPWSFLAGVLPGIGAHDIKRLDTQNLPPQRSGYPGIDWQIKEFEVTFTDSSGSARHADFICGICNAYGGYSAIIQSFSTTGDEFEHGKTWLPLLAKSVTAFDPRKTAYQDRVLPARNHPLDNSALMESWREKRLSQDRISQAQREGMMGYERTVSPTTGTHYNMPLETYDGTAGGYRNPDHPEELLKKAQPGE